jgi:translocation and assembly module TamB
MSRGGRIATMIGLSILGLIVLLVIAALIVVQTSWFRNFVREKIIAVTEESTGGKVDIASFNFDWTHLRATINGFVLHGTEPPSAAPLLQAKTLTVELKLFSGLKKMIDLRSLTVDTPQADVIVYPDGSTNVPSPKIKQKSSKSGLETVVDLAVGRFDLHNGSFIFASQRMPLNAQGRNLRAQLFYRTTSQGYEGRISLDPLLVDYGKNPPLNIHAEIPLVLQKDRISFNGTKITTPQSEIDLTGAVENMNDPRTSAQLNARLSVQELAPYAGLQVSKQPAVLTASANVTVGGGRIDVSSAHAAIGDSTLEASGLLQDPSGQGVLQLNGKLDLAELGRLFRIPQQPHGSVQLAANVKLNGASQYQATGNIHASNVSFIESGRRYSNIALATAFSANPKEITLNGLKLDAFGGEFAGNLDVKDMKTFQLAGDLKHFDIGALMQALTGSPSGYGGIASGPVTARGDLNNLSNTQANIQLAIAPGAHGLPLSGRLNATYTGATKTIDVAPSHLSLPHSRLDLSGSLGRQLQVHLTTRDLNDFTPALGSAAKSLPVTLGGQATFDGTVTGAVAKPHVQGHIAMTNFAIEGRSFDRLIADINASPSGASIQNAVLTRGPMQAEVSANIGLHNWKPESYEPVAANATIRNGDVADLLALAGQSDIPASGLLNASVRINGTVGNPTGSATLTAVNGKLYGEPYDRLQAQVNLADQLITIPSATLTSGAANLTLTASFQHPRDSFKTGHIEAHVVSNQIQLAQFQQFAKQTPGLAGTANTNLDVVANLNNVKGNTEFQLVSVNGNLNVRGLQAEGQNYGDLTATARTSGNTVTYNVDSNLAGSTIRVRGSTRLEKDYPTTADASISNLIVQRVLALAGRRDLPVTGTLSGTARFSGTLDKPDGSADMTLANAVIYDEPIDRIHARVDYTPQSINLPTLEIKAGPSQIALNATYTHAPGNLYDGQVRFQLPNSTVQLADLRTVQKYRPGLSGVLHLAADGAAAVKKAGAGEQFRIAGLNANVSATGLAINKVPLGDARLVAQTTGDRLNFTIDSDLAKSAIHGRGNATLRDDYPLTAQLTFDNVTYAGLRPFFNAASGPAPEFNASAAGQLSISGPVMRPDALTGRLQLTRLQVSTETRPGGAATPISISNQGPIVIALDRSQVRIESAHITGPQTDIRVTGSAPITGPGTMNVSIDANTNLALLQQMTRSIYASGAIVVHAVAAGTLTQPLINGRMELKNASLNLIDFPNGISNANGVITFSGNTANIQSLTAESGGGKINVSGFAGYGSGLVSYGLKVGITDIRIRYPEGAMIMASANLGLNGTTQNSVASGTVSVEQIGFSPHNDFGSMLSRTASPVKSPAAPSGPLSGMRLDIHIRTAPGVSFQTPLAERLQADADLYLRGTAANPGMTGRVNITEGDLVFFGTKYTVNQGTIAFYNPFDIQPVLNIDLETVAKGVDVVLTVSGPIDNMKLTYHSDPPLQFNELVSLLAAGKTPTSDPTILANQPATPPQTFQQMGESALVSQAIANPVSSRLQRVFGVSQLKIDPTFTSGSELPQARLTLQQQITSNVTFTYITNLTQANAQIIRVEWAINNTWSAIATREENGRFGMDFFYKKKFR